jgi:hypothetical protein
MQNASLRHRGGAVRIDLGPKSSKTMFRMGVRND